MTELLSWTMNMWEPIINLFSFIPNYGFMIIVFTICLKLILSPLDFWQKKVSRLNTQKQAEMAPDLARLKKLYGKNPQQLNQKTMQLYKEHNFNVMGSCVSMLINLVLTFFIFLTLFNALNAISQNKIYNQYIELEKVYTQKLGDTTIEYDSKKETAKQALIDAGIKNPSEQEISAKAYELACQDEAYAEIVKQAQKAVADKYEEIKNNWLWVDNIWRPDTSVAGYPGYRDFANLSKLTDKKLIKERNLSDDRINEIGAKFDVITSAVKQNYKSWNGYFILVLLAGGVTFLSIWVTQKTTPSTQPNKPKPVNNSVRSNMNDPQQIDPQKTMKIMQFILPGIMLLFSVMYSAAFAIYIVVNSAMATLLGFVSNVILNKIDKNKEIPEIERSYKRRI